MFMFATGFGSFTPDGKHYDYAFNRLLCELYAVDASDERMVADERRSPHAGIRPPLELSAARSFNKNSELQTFARVANSF